MRTVGSLVRIRGEHIGRIEKEHSSTHWVVSYIRHGVRYLERVPKPEVRSLENENSRS